jgi:hypothetical protein
MWLKIIKSKYQHFKLSFDIPFTTELKKTE